MDRANIETLLPLTGPQQAILIHKLQAGASGNVQVRFSIEGRVDDAVMARVWQQIVARHDALRSLIHMPEKGRPMQIVAKSARLDIETVDLERCPAAERAARLAEHIAKDTARELPLTALPASRLTVFRFGQERREYLWTVSKLFVDGWSAVLVLGEIMHLYRQARENTAVALPRVPSLQAYVGALKSVPTDASRAFWAEMFADYHATGPMFRTAPNGATETGALDLPEGLWSDVEAAAAKVGVTPTAFLCSAWALVLACCGAGRDISFALSLACRSLDLPGIEAMVGPLATTAPRRAQIAPDLSVIDLARQFHRAGFQAQPHENLSPIETFGGTEVTRHVPVPETLLTIETLPQHAFDLPIDGGIRLSGFQSDIASSFPVTLVVIPGAQARFCYAIQKLADAEFARRALSLLPRLLGDITRDPDRPAGELIDHYGIAPTGGGADEKITSGPCSPTEMVVAEIWKDVLEIDAVDMSRDFAAHGGRSFAAVRVLTRIEETFGTTIPLADFIRAAKIPQIARLITDGSAKGREFRTLVPFRANGAKPAVLFVHLGGHPVTFLTPMFDLFDKDRPFFAVQPVGVGTFDKPLTRFEDLARVHVDEFESMAPDGPVDVIGNCGGARLAFEVVRQLRDRGRDVNRLIVIDTRPPRMRGGPVVVQPAQGAARRRQSLPLRKALGLARLCSRAIRIAYAKATRDTELHLAVQSEIVERACYIADDAYRAQPMTQGDLKVVHTLNERMNVKLWENLALNVEHARLPVRHFTMFFSPEVEYLANGLQDWLD